LPDSSAIGRCVKKGDRPFPHPRPSACICGSKARSPFPPSASISIYLRFKSAIDLTSKRAIGRSPIRVHQRVSAVQKCDRPFPHPRPSACICGSKVRSPFRQKERSPLPPSASISVYLRFKSAIDRCVKKSDRIFYKYKQARCFQRNITPCNNDIYP